MKKTKEWVLVKFPASERSNGEKHGRVIMQGKTPNGFLERIMKEMMDIKTVRQFVYEIQHCPENDFIHSVSIGRYHDEDEMRREHSEMKNALEPLLKFLKSKTTEK